MRSWLSFLSNYNSIDLKYQKLIALESQLKISCFYISQYFKYTHTPDIELWRDYKKNFIDQINAGAAKYAIQCWSIEKLRQYKSITQNLTHYDKLLIDEAIRWLEHFNNSIDIKKIQDEIKTEWKELQLTQDDITARIKYALEGKDM